MPLKFPTVIPVNKNFRIRIDVLKDCQHAKAVEMVQNMAAGIVEFPNKEAIQRRIKSCTFFSVVDTDTGTPVGFHMVYGSPFVRSLQPRWHAQYTALKPEYRGGALSRVLINFCWPFALANGYEGSLARISMENPKWLANSQHMISAIPLVIPGGIQLSKGVTNDVVIYMDYSRKFIESTGFPKMSEEEKDFCISLHKDSVTVAPHCPRMEVKIPERKHTFSCGLEAIIKVASEDEEEEIEKLALEAAKDGHGFGEDEFLPNENLGKKNLHKYFMLIVKTEDGDAVCGAIIGPPILCRSSTTDKICGNIIVNKKYRRKKIGTEFMEICLQEVQNLGYKAVLTDILSTDIPTILPLVKRLGFTVIGSLPSCVKVKGHGWTDSIVIYKQDQTFLATMTNN